MERSADSLSPLRADRDVLQVRVRRRQPAGRRHRLVERRVYARVGRAQQWQGIYIGALQLGELAPLEDEVDDRMLATQSFQRVGVGAASGLGLAPAREAEIVVEEPPELLRAAGVERVPGDLLDLALDLGDPCMHLGADRPEEVAIYGDSLHLHGGEDGDEGQLHGVVEPSGVRPLHVANQLLADRVE